MNFQTIKGWTLLVLSMLVILAAALLAIMNARNTAVVHVYVESLPAFNTALLMLLSAAGGVVVLWMCILLANGVRAIRRGGREAARKTAQADPGAPSTPPGDSQPPAGGAGREL